MSSFMIDLWESIFTPGPTPTLLIAANVTFGALQLTLFGLLLGTHSYHFIILSALCAGLWASINWFAAELKRVQEVEKAAAAKKEQDDDDKGNEDGEDTEVEGAAERQVKEGSVALPVEPVEAKGELRKRGKGEVEVSQESTEDEWEKVSEESKED